MKDNTMTVKQPERPAEDEVAREMDRSKETLVRSYILNNCMYGNVPLKYFIGEVEKEMIIKALRVSGGNQRIASFILGIKPTTLNEKIKKFKIRGKNRVSDRSDLQGLLSDLNLSRL